MVRALAALVLSFELSALSFAASELRPIAQTPQRANAAAPLPVLFTVPPFTLTDQDGRAVSLSDIKGPWIADFIFTRCSSQCPMMTDRVTQASKRLPGMRFVSFSLDARDTPEVLKRYAAQHKAGWTFLTGKRGVVRKLSVEGFKLAAAEAKGGDAGDTISHSQYFVLVDAQGAVRGYYDAADAARLQTLVQDAKSLRPSQP